MNVALVRVLQSLSWRHINPSAYRSTSISDNKRQYSLKRFSFSARLPLKDRWLKRFGVSLGSMKDPPYPIKDIYGDSINLHLFGG